MLAKPSRRRPSLHSTAVTRSAVLGAALLLVGCIAVRPPSFLQSRADRQWPSTLTEAHRLAVTQSPIAADSFLARFSADYPGTDEAIQASYWRAVFRLDPAYGPNGARDALPLLDLFLSTNPPRERRTEAELLKRLAESVDALNQLVASASTKAMTSTAVAADANARAADARNDVRTVVADVQTLEAENKRLKTELAKANEELDRIRKRLAEIQKKGGRGGR
jgi:hypothetical protein